MNRIEVDLTEVTATGYVRVGSDRFPSAPKPGETIYFIDAIDNIIGYAIVHECNERTGLVYLDVDWPSLAEEEVTEP